MAKYAIPTLPLLLLASLAGCAQAEDVPADPETKRCLRLNDIKTSEVVDSGHIVFTLNNGSLYVSRLPHRCPGLRRNTAWMHSTPTNQICDLDTITVLENFGGRLQPGATCGLGKFEYIAQPDVDALRVKLEDAGAKQ